MIDTDAIRKYLEELKISFPRVFSFPFHILVTDMKQGLHNIKKFEKERPCFMSLNSFPSVTKTYNYKDGKLYYKPTSLKLERIFFDFDDKNLEKTYEDLIKLVTFCRENKIETFQQFTSGKGFHLFIELQPKIYKFNGKSKDVLKKVIRSFQEWIIDYLDLKTYDNSVLGVPERMVRIPSTVYVSGNGFKTNGLFCTPLTQKEILELDVTEIKNIAKRRRYKKVTNGNKKFELKELLEKFEIKIKRHEQKQFEIVECKDFECGDEVLILLKEILKEIPCIFNQIIKSNNPKHFARVAYCLACKKRGLTIEETNLIWEKVGEIFNFEDLNLRDKRIYHIKNIFSNSRYNKIPSCKKIQTEYKVCIGDKCEKFKYKKTLKTN